MEGSRQGLGTRSWRWLWAFALITGTGIQIWLWLRAAWLYRDQVELYSLGMALVRDGQLLPFGKLATGDYPIPGVLLELLVGLPLLGWLDYRASSLVLVGFHLTAALLLSRLLVEDLGWRFATLYLAVFWLSPWRLYHSGFLWEANYLMLPAALHMVSCRTLWRRPSLGASTLLAATVLLSAQLHGSFVILVLCSLWLGLRRHLQLDLRGLALGSLLAALPLVPTLSALFEGGALPGGSAGSPDLLLRLNSLEKGFLYWFRLSSLDLGRRFRQSLFCQQPGSELIPDPWLCRIVHLTEILALASIAVSLVAAAWWIRRSKRPDPASRGDSPERWYRTYSIAMLVAVLGSALLSPVLLQGWHVLIALPAACLPVAGWMLERWPTAGGWLRTGMVLFVFWRLPASLLLVGHPMYARPASPDLPRHIVPQDLQVLLPQLDD